MAANKKTQLLLIQSGAVIAFLVVLAVGTLLVYRARHPVQEPPREEMRTLHRALELGDNKAGVRAAFRLQNFETLTMVEDAPEQGIWEVRTPFEWNAGNWIMWIVFREDEVHGIIIGTQDNMLANPQGAPRDKMTEDLEAWLQQQRVDAG